MNNLSGDAAGLKLHAYGADGKLAGGQQRAVDDHG